MLRLLWILPVFTLFGASPMEEPPVQDLTALHILDISDSAQPREILFRDFCVLEDLGEILVVRPEASDPGRSEELGIPLQRISIPDQAGDLCVASLKGLEKDKLSKLALVLHTADEIALVAAGPDARSRLERPVAHYGLEKGIRLLNLDRALPPPAFSVPYGWTAGARAADARIQAMVGMVSETNLQDMVQDLENFGERKANSGAYAAETYLVNSFNAISGLSVSTHNFSGSYADNVIAELPGVIDPSVIYVVGGHYDSTASSSAAPGADDNASGTAAVREIARILSQHQFKYTLRFCAFNAEELGLVGSDAYCDYLVSQNANVDAMINLDMTAYLAPGDTRDVDFVLNYSSSSLINFCTSMYNTYVPALGVKQGNLSGGTSDHQSFTQHGYTACFPFEDIDNYSPYIHSSNDLVGLSANDFTLAKMITQGSLAAIATLASPLDLEIIHTPLPDTMQGFNPYPVNADVKSLIGSSVSKATLHYDIGSGFVSKEMAYTGTGDGYLSSIPGLYASGYVKYYIEAEDNQGYTERLPSGLEAEYFEFYVGHFNDIFADDFEINDNGWTHGGTGQDDWMRDVPTGNGGYDAGFASSGTKVWGNDLGISGYNGNYQSNVNNWLESPSIDCTGETGVTLRYRRWVTVEKGTKDQAKILVNGTAVYSNPLATDLIDTAWELHTVDISAYADNNPDVKLRFTLTTDSNGVMGGWNVDDLHVGTQADPDPATLSTSEILMKISTGGAITLTLDGDAAQAGRTYLVAASITGTQPGTQIGSITLPLNWDFLTNFALLNVNTAAFTNFLGALDGNGDAVATFNVPVISDPSVIGFTFNFAWLTLNPIDFASNAVGLLFVP